MKLTGFISLNPTEKPEPEENYEEELVINAIAQLATVNARIGRNFNQSDEVNTTNETNMHGTRSLMIRDAGEQTTATFILITAQNSTFLKSIIQK